MLLGDGTACESAISAALELSPIDPLLYGMYGVRAQMLMQKEDFAAAAHWADKAAATPGAHHLIALIAAAANSLAGHEEQATRWARLAWSKRPDATALDYSHAFPIRNSVMRAKIESVLRKRGF
jgi:hypothetical protein